jgi:hypothetical protein
MSEPSEKPVQPPTNSADGKLVEASKIIRGVYRVLHETDPRLAESLYRANVAIEDARALLKPAQAPVAKSPSADNTRALAGQPVKPAP